MAKILIVDDDDQLRTVLRAILEQVGYDVIDADSGKKCLELLRGGEKPDLILLDVMMPELDGWETCRLIKEDPKIKDIKVAMLTVRSQDPDKVKTFGYATANWHIAKPIDKESFLETIKWILAEPETADK